MLRSTGLCRWVWRRWYKRAEVQTAASSAWSSCGLRRKLSISATMNKLWIIALVVTFLSPSFANPAKKHSNPNNMQSNRAKKHSNPNNMQSNRDAKFLFSSEYYCWTQWFDRDDPTVTGDWETLSDLRKQFPDKVCPDPVDLEATTLSGTPADQTGEVFFKYDTTSGFVCRNEDQNGGMCKDYRVRFSCPSSYCTEKVCWTEWFDRDNPSGTGDWELLSDLRRENPGQICETPQYIQAKADSVLGVFKRDKFYIYNPTKGFVCRNKDQKFTDCWDYKVRFGCC
uniref:WxxW domain-containing protein n=1 Tax=Oryzias melastigma TaxID=30732 RepID=A0A3B3BRR3_ORYME